MNLQDMNSKELEALKRKWYVEASDKIQQLYSIARELGDRVPHNYGPKYRYADNGLNIYVDDYGHYMTVHLDGKLIVSTHNERLYVPGEWESVIHGLYTLANQTEVERNENKEHAEKSKLVDSLTLPETKSNIHPVFEQILKPYMP